MTLLVLVKGSQSGNVYGRYAGEILRAEGLNCYQIQEAGGQSADDLSGYEVVIVTYCTLEADEVEALVEYVEGGGTLAVFRPSVRLGEALGLEPTFGAQKGGYLSIDDDHTVCLGLSRESIQIHGVADHWGVPSGSGLSVVAHLSATQSETPDEAGLVVGARGKGRLAVWTFDLPATVAAIRQGDPERANTTCAGLDGIYRPSELFVGHLDPACSQVPQADVHTALLASVVEWLIGHPTPRLWYYPEPAQRSVLIMTSDDDWSKIAEFDALIAATEARDGHIEFYLVPGTRVTQELAADWVARGHAISVHPDFRAIHGAPATLRQHGLDEQVLHERDMLSASVAAIEEQFGVKVRTVRNHAARWSGYLDAAYVMEELGVGMDFNYVSIWPFSATYMTGSGRPLRFVDRDGTILGLFQQSTLYSEDVVVQPTYINSIKCPTEPALAHFQGFMDESIDRFYTPIGLNSHPVSFADYSAPFVEGIFDMARERDMAIISASEWLDFTLARYATEFAGATWDGERLRFVIEVSGRPRGLAILLPLCGREVATATVDGIEQPVVVATRWERRYALLSLDQPSGDAVCEVSFRPL